MRYFNWLFAALASTTSAYGAALEMKEIQYRGGIINFSVPKNWVEESEPDGGAMFYEDAPDTGTLRLNVITATSPQLLSDDAAFERLAAMSSVAAGSVQRLKNGNAIATSILRSTEQGHAITLFWWYVTNPVRPNHMRIANFSYTVLTEKEGSETVKRDVQLLTEAIKNSRFHPTLGE
ncbi:hypothetical protein [Aquabacterium commune]|uniref:hypothetical protein n=1 Tax=Aquabacterium commune TaxID=70586 RepID=UPI00105E09E6|nr:hypothetical protein [Aquabacterium commune]